MGVVVEALRGLGLTEYEARAYDIIVGLPQATASQVAHSASIPPTKVYAVLTRLVERGYVRRENGRPQRFIAQRPRDIFANHQKESALRAEEALRILEGRFVERGSVFSGPFWLLHGAHALVERLRILLPDARESILAAIPFPLPEVDRPFLELLEKAHRRGVRVRVMVAAQEGELFQALKRIGCEIRIGTFPMRPILMDGRHGLITFLVPRPGGQLDPLAVWTPVPELVTQLEPAIRLIFDRAPLAEVSAAAAGGPPRRGNGHPHRTRPGPA